MKNKLLITKIKHKYQGNYSWKFMCIILKLIQFTFVYEKKNITIII